MAAKVEANTAASPGVSTVVSPGVSTVVSPGDSTTANSGEDPPASPQVVAVAAAAALEHSSSTLEVIRSMEGAISRAGTSGEVDIRSR